MTQANQDTKNVLLINWIGTLFLGFIPCLILFLTKKDDKLVLDQSKEALNWSITAMIGYFACTFLIGFLTALFSFGLLGIVTLAMAAIGIAHIVFCISFVVVTVKARIASLDPRLEQAAMDLYANEFETFRRVTFPLVLPGIAAAALLAFSLSFDDFIITNFNSGTLTTFPKFVWISSARGVPAQANVIGSAMFLIALVIVIAAQLFGNAKAKKKG